MKRRFIRNRKTLGLVSTVIGFALIGRVALAEPPAVAGDEASLNEAPPAVTQRPAAGKPNPAPAAETDPAAAESSPVTAITKLSPDPSRIGDLLELEVVVAYPDGYTVNLPTGVDLSPLEIVETTESEPESTGSGWRRTFGLTLQFFSVGEATVPSFALTFVDPQGSVHTLSVASRKFTVESLLANEVDPTVLPEDPPVSLTYPAEAAEMAIYSGLAALLAGLVLARAWSRWRRRQKPAPMVPAVPPHERANGALTDLESRRTALLEAGRVADYYLELTEITKLYVQSRFGIDALDRTTEEIRRALTRAGDRLTPLSPTELIRFLQECDLVKFARVAPTDEDAASSLESVRNMVDRSTPKPQTSKAADETTPPHNGGPPVGANGNGTRAGAAPSSRPDREVA